MFCFVFTISSKFLTVSTPEHFQKQIISIISASIIFNGSHQVGCKFVTDCYQQQLKHRDWHLLLASVKWEEKREETWMKIKETTREDMTAEGRKQKRREETGRLGRISAPQRAAGATHCRLFKATGKGDAPLLGRSAAPIIGRGYYLTSFARMSKMKHGNINTTKQQKHTVEEVLLRIKNVIMGCS